MKENGLFFLHENAKSRIQYNWNENHLFVSIE